MDDMVKMNQRAVCDAVIAELRKELELLEAEGNWHDANRCEQLIVEWLKRKEEIPK
jgi:hypothetical protein